MRQFVMPILAFASISSSATITSYGLGNSLMDQLDGIPNIAHSKGDSCNHTRYTIPGCGIQCLWVKAGDGTTPPPGPPDDFSAKPLDCVLAEAFCNGAELFIDADATYMGKYYDIALAKNANCRLLVFTQWMPSDGSFGNYTWQTLWPTANPTGGYCASYGTAAYHEGLVTKLRTMYPNKEIDLMPFGHVMYLFDQQAAAGQIPGYTGAFGLYADGIHLNSAGKYLQNLTAYSVMFKKDPHSAGLSFGQWSGTESVTQAFATIAQDLVWTTVTGKKALTNVNGPTDVGPGLSAPRAAIRQSGAPATAWGIDGRAVARSEMLRGPRLVVIPGRGVIIERRSFWTAVSMKGGYIAALAIPTNDGTAHQQSPGGEDD